MDGLRKQPKRHHYVPQFLLSRWGRQDGRVHTHRRTPEGEIFETWLLPREVGAQNHLWSLSEYHKKRGILESQFFSPIDSKASNIICKLESYSDLKDDERVDWAIFIASLLVRSPATIEHISKIMPQEIVNFVKNSPINDKINDEVLDNFEKIPKYLEDVALSTIVIITMNERNLETILDMHWMIRRLVNSQHHLLISDRPVTRCFSILDPRCLLAFPISPVSFFVASGNKQLLHSLIKASDKELTTALNKNAAGLARSFVVGECQPRFLERHFLVSLQ